MGLGVNNLIMVKANEKGQMDAQDLRAKILTAKAEVHVQINFKKAYQFRLKPCSCTYILRYILTGAAAISSRRYFRYNCTRRVRSARRHC